jgi:hypothetical protein
MRPSNLLGLLFLIAALGLLLSMADAAYRRGLAADVLKRDSQLVAELGLTDLVLFTEARYTRHWTQSDLHSAFQDHPLALEHFPSGSLIPPPRRGQGSARH